MPTMDSTAKTAIAGQTFAAAYYFFLDILNDPLRFTTIGVDQTVSGSGDSELDGSYPAFGGQLIDVGDIANSDSGSDTLQVTLSGILELDAQLLNEIGDRSKWQGRLCRIWCRIYDADGLSPQGAIFPIYTGYMSSVEIVFGEQQTIILKAENYLAAFNDASNRSYMGQKDFDSGDNSAAATLAAANAARHHGGAASSTGGGGGGGASSGGSYKVGPGMGGPGLEIY